MFGAVAGVSAEAPVRSRKNPALNIAFVQRIGSSDAIFRGGGTG